MCAAVAILGTRGYPSYYGGFETLVRSLAPYLADHGWQVTVYGRPGSVSPGGDPRIATPMSRGFNTKSLSALTHGWSAARMTARARPDVALIMNVANGYWLGSLRRRGIPVVLNVDGLEWEREKWNGLARRVFRGGATRTADLADTLVFDSQVLADRWREDFDRDGVFIPYGGQDPGPLPVPEGLTHRGYILIVARFVPENTVEEFFAAVPDLARRHDVVIVGSSGHGGPLDAEAARLDAENPRVRWLGHVRDDDLLFSLWQHARVYFHGHSVGGTNPALVQAMACGAPTLARDTPFNREVLGSAGRFTEPTAEGIVAAVERLIQDEATSEWMGRAARARAAERYSWDGVLGAYHRCLLDCVLAGSRSADAAVGRPPDPKGSRS